MVISMDIHDKILELCKYIKNDENRIKLKEASINMENSDEVQALAYKYSVSQHDYSVALNHYDENSEEVKKAQKELFICKKKLDEHPLVKEYNKYFILCNEPLRYLEYNLFSLISNKKVC